MEECLGSAFSQFKDLGNYSGDTRKAPTKGNIVSGKELQIFTKKIISQNLQRTRLHCKKMFIFH